MENEEKQYFTPGMIVTLRLNIPNKPIMVVEKKREIAFKDANVKTLQGIECFWFTTSGEIQRNCFNTKDLLQVNN